MNKTKRNKKKTCRQVIIPESENWARTATPAPFGPVSRCVRLWRTLREQTAQLCLGGFEPGSNDLRRTI